METITQGKRTNVAYMRTSSTYEKLITFTKQFLNRTNQPQKEQQTYNLRRYKRGESIVSKQKLPKWIQVKKERESYDTINEYARGVILKALQIRPHQSQEVKYPCNARNHTKKANKSKSS